MPKSFWVKPHSGSSVNTDTYYLNLVKSNQTWIVITLYRLIQHRMEFCLALNQSEKCNYSPNLVYINQIWKRFLKCLGHSSSCSDTTHLRFLLYQPKLDCIYHFPIGLESSNWFTLLSQINAEMVNTIWVSFD